MTKFYNPYQFVPFTAKVNGHGTPLTDYADIVGEVTELSSEEALACRHDFWQSETFSGRLICRLTNKTPMMLGNEQTAYPKGQNRPAEVGPYLSVITNDRAIPANSIKGVLSSTVEMLSQSAMRVINDAPMSVRMAMGDAMSAIGLLQHNARGELELLPLTLPNIRQNDIRRSFARWRSLLPQQHNLGWYLSAYIGNYMGGNGAKKVSPHSVLANKTLASYKADEPLYYYARLNGNMPALGERDAPDYLASGARPLHTRTPAKGKWVLLGQQLCDYNELLSEAEWSTLAHDEQKKYTRGVLYVLGIENKKYKQMPGGKEHELFIPLPESKLNEIKPLAIPPRVLKAFAETAFNAFDPDAGLPLVPTGYCHSLVKKDSSDFMPRAGHLMYFRLDDSGSCVSELSYSAIWRTHKGSVFDYIAHKHLLPWGTAARDGAALSPAERLFGVVESKKQEGAPQTRNLAGRVRVSEAISVAEVVTSKPMVLKKLNSPKLPCPSFYFTGRSEGFIAKNQLNQSHSIRGHKRYLHHDNQLEQMPACQTRLPDNDSSMHQHLKIEPIAPNQTFYFHIDVENITPNELGLLITALTPSETFLHKLGLGKPLGLGSVQIQPLLLCQLKRTLRYSAEGFFDCNRYHGAWFTPALGENFQALSGGELYGEELASIAAAEEWVDWPQQLVDQQTLAIAKQLGEPEHLQDYPVRYPFVTDEKQEQELFKWFTDNESGKGTKQYLPSVEPGKPLPPLHSGTLNNTAQQPKPATSGSADSPRKHQGRASAKPAGDRKTEQRLITVGGIDNTVRSCDEAKAFCMAVVEALAARGEENVRVWEVGERHGGKGFWGRLICENRAQVARITEQFSNRGIQLEGYYWRPKLHPKKG